MGTALAWAGPGMVLVLVIVGSIELLRKKRNKATGTPLSATYLDEFTAFLYGTKRTELDHRDTISMMREEQEQGAPPDAVDLDQGVMRVRRGPLP